MSKNTCMRFPPEPKTLFKFPYVGQQNPSHPRDKVGPSPGWCLPMCDLSWRCVGFTSYISLKFIFPAAASCISHLSPCDNFLSILPIPFLTPLMCLESFLWLGQIPLGRHCYLTRMSSMYPTLCNHLLCSSSLHPTISSALLHILAHVSAWLTLNVNKWKDEWMNEGQHLI